jgi:2-isopropylmalate synthase
MGAAVADRVEWFLRNLERRDEVILSVHAHNDRGTGVATAELSQLAGAERIEGILLGNDERNGNVDIVTLAMNLYSQGIDPELDFSQMPEVVQVVEHCTEMRVHPRWPSRPPPNDVAAYTGPKIRFLTVM